ncbi:prolyl oligopeptidase family serine peptidase [Staphylococcus lugdunensis]|uniref:alpha/beta hydrolase family protein n=1 Tax=Staphylococcus lugdunensis TaxID=28035 RepID=UPI001F4C788D|nr:prolyl oligopeptidase family serine peptidase [Staphylococcus lugdunensis]MCH8647797.1 prolyl oligopeptidase family serine peptidase [Staphylococcus lugdunensis]
MDYILYKTMPIESLTHEFAEVTYVVDGLKVKALQMLPHKTVERIVVYLRGGKGQVGRVRAARLMQFSSLVQQLHQSYPNAYIHMIGFSRGGLQGLLTFQDLPVDSYIIWGGVSNVNLMYEERVDLRGMLRRMIGHPVKDSQSYKKRDALKDIDATSPPILIIHGGQDKQVGIHQAYVLEDALKQRGTQFDTFYQLAEGHVPRPVAMRLAIQRIFNWMKEIEELQK